MGFHIVADTRQRLPQPGVFFAFGFGNGVQFVGEFFENARVSRKELLG
ncbi:hypothetical protein [Chloracidobacterium thermophilum]|nr:hypothetical protein [Chloracidobacterium thermophilum]QUV78360.1 hypothetical protein J8C08_09690 [Chloracidobacterium thermophilum]